MEDPNFAAMERLENALGELSAARKHIGEGHTHHGLNEMEISIGDWLPMIARGNLMDARHATEQAIKALETARNAIHELQRMTHGDAE